MLDPRNVSRLSFFIVLPIVLVVLPTAIAINLWALFKQEAFYQNALYLCVSLAIVGGSASILTLPELLRLTNGRISTLTKLVVLLITMAGLVLGILIQIAQKVDLQTMILVALLIVSAGLIYAFKQWTNWTLK